MFAHVLLIELACAQHTRGAVSQRLELHEVDLRGVDAQLFGAVKHMSDEKLLVEAGGGPDGDPLCFTQAFALAEKSKVHLGLRIQAWYQIVPELSPHFAPTSEAIAPWCRSARQHIVIDYQSITGIKDAPKYSGGGVSKDDVDSS